jgi:hypothetical protein
VSRAAPACAERHRVRWLGLGGSTDELGTEETAWGSAQENAEIPPVVRRVAADFSAFSRASGASGPLAGPSVEKLAGDVEVSGVAGVLLDQVQQDPLELGSGVRVAEAAGE